MMLKNIFINILCMAFGWKIREKILEQNYQLKAEELGKYKLYYDITCQWLSIHRECKRIDEYLLSKGYKNIAIYGMGELGRSLYEELQKTEINIRYKIDQAKNLYADCGVEILESIADVDLIIITPIHTAFEIRKMIKEKNDCHVLTLSEIIFDM